MIHSQFGPSAALPQDALLGERSQLLSSPAQPEASLSQAIDAPKARLGSGLRYLRAGLGVCLALGTSMHAQDSFHVSLSSTKTVGNLTLDDAALVRADASGSLSPVLTEGHWQALVGFVPTDLDAFSRREGFDPESAESMGFSLLSDQGGFKDGDILAFAPGGGLEVLLAESELLNALGVPAGNLDVDAIDLGSTDRIYLSLQGDLAGTLLGDIKDGDLILYDVINSGVSLHVSEDEFQTAFGLATGSSAPILDVLGICLNAGEVYFSVQSPSSWDGAVLSMQLGGSVVRDEGSMGLGGAELNALDMAPVGELPCFGFDQLSATPGDSLQLTIHGKPLTLYVALFSGGTGSIDFSQHPGWGQVVMDPGDSWLMATLSMASLPFVVTDGQGDHQTAFVLPTAMLYGSGFANEEGWSFQMLEVPGLRLSAPFRVLKN